MENAFRIALLIGFVPNPRMEKRICLEKSVGEFHLICWNKKANMLERKENDGYQAHYITIASGSDPIRRLLPYAVFFRKAMQLLCEIKPHVIHVQGIDMLSIACMYRKKAKASVRIIYEVADLHRLLVDKQKNPVRKNAQTCLLRLDRRLAPTADLLIVTSERFVETYFGSFVPRKKTMFIPNAPELTAFRTYQKQPHRSRMTIGFIGSVRYKKQMKNLLEAAERADMDVLIAGYEMEPIEIEPLCKDKPNVRWIGQFDFESRAAELYAQCDLMYSVYDADMSNVRVALPNKLYESVYCEVPLIVAKETYLAQLVEEWGVGVSVDHKEPDNLAQTLIKIKQDRSLYDSFIEHCKEHKAEVDLLPYHARFEKVLRNWAGDRK